jgi:uridine kinase
MTRTKKTAAASAKPPAAGPSKSPVVVGVSGGSGAGKSLLVEMLAEKLGHRRCTVLRHDSYYRDQSALSPGARSNLNYDHPDQLETELLIEHVRSLSSGQKVEVPVYDFESHVREPATVRQEAREFLLLEGHLLFTDAGLRELMDLRVFLHADADVRLARRIRRDVHERGRTVESVIDQYFATVKPMHDHHVEPGRRHAHLILVSEDDLESAVEIVAGGLEGLRRRAG